MSLKLCEADLQRTCEEFLQLDGWRIIRLEQNYSERKRKVVGEAGAPDMLGLRYGRMEMVPGLWTPAFQASDCQIMWCEWKSARGKPSAKQLEWHQAERARGALTLIAGIDFPASIDGFMDWYRSSGLLRRKGL